MRQYIAVQTFSIGKDTYTVSDTNSKKVLFKVKGRVLDVGAKKLKIFDDESNEQLGIMTTSAFNRRSWALKDSKKGIMGKVKFGGLLRNKVKVEVNGKEYVSKSFGERNFEIKNSSGAVVLSIHKKGLSFKDKFYIDDFEIFPPIVSAGIAVLVDQHYHDDD